MQKTAVMAGVMLLLGACGDPLSGITRISDVELTETEPTAQALPSADEIAREGFFGTAAAEPVATAPDPAILPAAATATAQAPGDPILTEPAPRRGLMGFLRRTLPGARTEAGGAQDTLTQDAFETAKAAEATTPELTELASLSPDIPPQPTATPAPQRRGLFGRLRAAPAAAKAREGVDARDVTYGTVLPFGTVARVCDARRKSLGRKIESASASGYKLYDSNPGTSGLRTFYITGFDDDCPRQLTAAHVLLGEPSFYEQLHYGPAGQHLAFGETDRAYEQVKSRVCGVRKGKPCGAKMRQLERDTFFVNMYARMDDNTSWSELLVHGSAVVAAAQKTSG